MTSAASEKTIRAQRAQAERDLTNAKIVVESIMSLPSGRRWVWLMLERGQMFAERGPDFDLHHLAYQTGRRDVMMRFMKEVQGWTPEMYIRMVNENAAGKIKESPDERSTDYDPDDYSGH